MKTYNHNKISLIDKPGTIGFVIDKNKDELFAMKSPKMIHDRLETLFNENAINTPKSREILMNFKFKIKSQYDAIGYIHNIWCSAANMALIR